jgi:F0F1-type ATP synthase assembly protein I
MLLIATALDTTWRIFVPILGGVFLGIGIDTWLGVAPFAMLAGLIIGIIITVLLIIRQLIDVRKTLS